MRVVWLLVFGLCGCSGSASQHGPDTATEGKEVTINDLRAETCFERVLTAANSRYHIERRATPGAPGRMMWYPESAKVSETLNCEVIKCLAGPDSDPARLPENCRGP